MAKKHVKTNAIRMIEQQKIPYTLFEYEIEKGGSVDGQTVAAKVGQPLHHVFKTLVTTAGKDQYFVLVIPVTKELNLKNAAKVVGVKKLELLPVNELLGLTGYVRGGCSPVGMKKQFPTWIDTSAEELEFMVVSAGKIGMQMKLNPQSLATASRAHFAALTD